MTTLEYDEERYAQDEEYAAFVDAVAEQVERFEVEEAERLSA